MYLRRLNGDLIAEGDDIKLLVTENKANLQGAILQGANLQNTNLQNAILRGAILRGAILRGANLQGAILRGANLQGADLQGADLQGADLQGADLRGAKRQGYVLKSTPIQIGGLCYFVIIFDEHMEIGCEKHDFITWAEFTDEQILGMGGHSALKFWKDNKYRLLAFYGIQADNTQT